ncbi:hypothetical protein [Pseudomonas izuensis]|uniref:Uncharacterized protein n=1 Tax=Pseudomonas izuensis TaxID=2684212 RepID=A0ABM7RZR2_9PSED|nr:hypothetical protein [Pseudomonas izuensis]BCX67968.1 hypothetical protein LAB08_R26070 [Pseudomonas izuensis]
MAKTDVPTNVPQTAAEPVLQTLAAPGPTLMKFRDKVFTSRLLILPETERSLPVAKAMVEVPSADSEAIRFLKAHDDFELLKE